MQPHYLLGLILHLEQSGEKKPQPLRFAPVGMAVLLFAQDIQRRNTWPRNRTVIPTGANPDFLLRGSLANIVCGLPLEKAA